MPSRLRPVSSVAAEAILVGDPGRALLLAQELLLQPKMCNHARGLWGYSGTTPAGRELTVQSTGMGGPSAALVLADLAELGVRRGVRVGTCAALDPTALPGDLLTVSEARDWTGGRTGEPILPNLDLSAALAAELGAAARPAVVASLDSLHRGGGSGSAAYAAGADAADMQTTALFDRGAALGVALAAVLIVAESSGGEKAGDEALEQAAKRAGIAASAIL